MLVLHCFCVLKLKPSEEVKRTSNEQRSGVNEELVEEGIYTIDKFKEKVSAIEVKLAALKSSLSETIIDAGEMETCVNECLRFLEHLPKTWINLSPNNKSKLHEILFPEGIRFDGEVSRTPKLNPIFAQIKKIDDAETVQVEFGGHWLPNLELIIQYLKDLFSLYELISLMGSLKVNIL